MFHGAVSPLVMVIVYRYDAQSGMPYVLMEPIFCVTLATLSQRPVRVTPNSDDKRGTGFQPA